MVYDRQMWIRWALYIHHNGLTNAYSDPTVAYYPVYLYFLYVYDLIKGTDAAIIQDIGQLKYATLVFDFLPVIVLCCFKQNKIKEKIPYLFLLLNIAYLYNTMIWGQMDSIHTALIFLSVLFAFDKPVLGIVLYAIAFCTKPQAIIYLPVITLITLYKLKGARQLFALLFAGVATAAVCLSPFLLAGKGADLVYVATHFVNYFHHTSMGAFNMWYLLLRDSWNTMDYEKIGPLTYNQVGYILFFGFSAIVLLILLARLLRLKYKNMDADNNTMQLIMLASGLIALYFFYFNTQMHERYSHPMLLFFFFYGVYSRNFKVFFLACIPYALSLEKCYPNYFPIPHYKIIFAAKIIGVWYTLLLAYATYELLRQYKLRLEWKMAIEAISNRKIK